MTLPAPSVGLIKATDKGLTMIIRNVRIAFVNIDKPRPGMEKDAKTGEPTKYQYELTALVPKKSKVQTEIIKLIQKAVSMSSTLSGVEDKKGKSEKKSALERACAIDGDGSVIKDGDNCLQKNSDKPYDGLAGNFVVKMKANAVQNDDGTFKPKVDLRLVRADKSEIRKHEIADEIYSGAWVDISCTLFPYKFLGKTGVTVYLNGIQKLKDDVKLGGFDPFEVRDDIVSAQESEETPETY